MKSIVFAAREAARFASNDRAMSPPSMLQPFVRAEAPFINRKAFDYYPPLRKIRAFVETNYAEPLSLRQAARVAGLERKYFSAYFRKKVGICFRDWLRRVRVEQAIRILASEDHSMIEVADKVGFGDVRTFERSFKKCTGLTPRDVKKRLAP